MIQILTKNSIIDMLENPQEYINEDCDELMLRIFHSDVSNPVFLLLGYDGKIKRYYFTLKDNERSEYFYCEDKNLKKMYKKIMEGKGEYKLWVKG